MDLAGTRAKYREERDKRRLQKRGIDQWINIKDSFGELIGDPHADPNFERDPKNDEVEMIIVGGGFGGLFVAARLRMAGLQHIRNVERRRDFGGTWYWNRYPGRAG